MSEVERYWIDPSRLVQEGWHQDDTCVVKDWAYDRVTAERDALQQRLTAADERVDVLEGWGAKQAALLEELGIPLDEVEDLFGETLKNAKRYEYLRSIMAVENFPAPHPAWSEPSEAESKRVDDLCDAALKPAEGQPLTTCTWSSHDFSWISACGMSGWEFTDGGAPAENGMHFCHSCGKTLAVEGEGDE